MISMGTSNDYDVIVIGGGPSGSTAALQLARDGFRVCVIERSRFPRFHVGESFLPRGFNLLGELGLGESLKKLPHVPKFGAEFGFAGEEETTRFIFSEGLDGSRNETFNMARAEFDTMMLNAATDAGATLLQGDTVKKILKLQDGDVSVSLGQRTLTARYLLDASGQATVLGRHLGTREGLANHRKVAYFGHFEGVERLSGLEEGHPTIVICQEGWFWMIPIDARRMSIGLVMDADDAQRVDVPAADMLAWGIDRCPLVRRRTALATFPEKTHRAADFSYYCKPYAGPGYFLIGDAAFFLDPVFSSGICLGMMGAVQVAKSVAELVRPSTDRKTRGRRTPAAHRRAYTRYVDGSTSAFFRLVNLFYDHAFQELFLSGGSPLQIRPAVISILSGHVFPKPAWRLRWRLRLLEQLVRVQRHFPIVPRRRRYSLLEAAPVDASLVAP